MFWKIHQLMLKMPMLQNIRILFFFFDWVVLKFIKKPKRTSATKNVLLVFPLSLGDAVMMHGSLSMLREKFSAPDYELNILCQTGYEELFEDVCDVVISVNLRKASTHIRDRILFLKTCRSKYYDVVIDPTGMEECYPGVFAVYASCADVKIGVLSNRDKKYQTPRWLMKSAFTDVIYMEEKFVHKVRYYAEVFSKITRTEKKPTLAKISVRNRMDLPEKYIIVYPSASIPAKRWPVERFVSVTEQVLAQWGVPIVVCGTNSDYEINQSYISRLKKDIAVIDFTGKTSVMEFVELIGRATFVFTNDTSVYHIAIAMHRKTCCVTGAYVYKSFVDYKSEGLVQEDEVAFVAPTCVCMNCENQCDKEFNEVYPCVMQNTEEQVKKVVAHLMRERI